MLQPASQFHGSSHLPVLSFFIRSNPSCRVIVAGMHHFLLLISLTLTLSIRHAYATPLPDDLQTCVHGFCHTDTRDTLTVPPGCLTPPKSSSSSVGNRDVSRLKRVPKECFQIWGVTGIPLVYNVASRIFFLPRGLYQVNWENVFTDGPVAEVLGMSQHTSLAVIVEQLKVLMCFLCFHSGS